jgi:hypothetical protein
MFLFIHSFTSMHFFLYFLPFLTSFSKLEAGFDTIIRPINHNCLNVGDVHFEYIYWINKNKLYPWEVCEMWQVIFCVQYIDKGMKIYVVIHFYPPNDMLALLCLRSENYTINSLALTRMICYAILYENISRSWLSEQSWFRALFHVCAVNADTSGYE